jgi:hypothetical protein
MQRLIPTQNVHEGTILYVHMVRGIPYILIYTSKNSILILKGKAIFPLHTQKDTKEYNSINVGGHGSPPFL